MHALCAGLHTVSMCCVACCDACAALLLLLQSQQLTATISTLGKATAQNHPFLYSSTGGLPAPPNEMRPACAPNQSLELPVLPTFTGDKGRGHAYQVALMVPDLSRFAPGHLAGLGTPACSPACSLRCYSHVLPAHWRAGGCSSVQSMDNLIPYKLRASVLWSRHFSNRLSRCHRLQYRPSQGPQSLQLQPIPSISITTQPLNLVSRVC
jgi:hypothetical protein